MRLKSAEYRQEKGQNKCAIAGWVGGFPCRGQEAPQCALQAVSPTPGAVSTTLPKALKMTILSRQVSDENQARTHSDSRTPGPPAGPSD
jgi:hypothetical protein